MKRLMLSAPNSGSGKTVVTCGLLQAYKNRGVSVESYKCGPDYIDPMFHRRVLGVPGRNLDLFLQGPAGVRRTLSGQTAELALVEGAMGFYDGVGGTDQASAWAVAEVLSLPVVLVLRPKGVSLTLAAQVKGLMEFRQPSHIAGVILTDCKPMLYAHWKPILEREAGLPVFGYLPPMEEAALESRHLGLVTASEVDEFLPRFARIGAQMEKTVDLDALLACGAEISPPNRPHTEKTAARCTIAVARDDAFCFYYEDSLDALRAAGADLRFFSPLQDTEPPCADGLYLGGGYPELYGKQLKENTAMRTWVRESIQGGLPTVAECGGFLYLLQTLESHQGETCLMTGALEGEGYRTHSLQRFGYLHLTADEDSLLFRRGESVPAHEFHYWDATHCGESLQAVKPSGKTWRCGVATPTLYASFPHLHFGGDLPLAQRFADAAAAYHREKHL